MHPPAHHHTQAAEQHGDGHHTPGQSEHDHRHPQPPEPAAHGAHCTAAHSHHNHTAMVADFRRRCWVSLALSIPLLALTPVIQQWLGLKEVWRFPGDQYVQFALASAVFFYGGWPFLNGTYDELRRGLPGMMTLIGLAIVVAYVYSSAVVFGLGGMVFFWELATLIDIMLLGHWVEMRSVLGASAALEKLVRLMPWEAHRLRPDGSAEEVPVTSSRPGDRVLVKPGEKILSMAQWSKGGPR